MEANRASISHINTLSWVFWFIFLKTILQKSEFRDKLNGKQIATNGRKHNARLLTFPAPERLKKCLLSHSLLNFWRYHYIGNVFAHSTVLTTRKPNVPSQRSSCPNFEKTENFSGRKVRYLQCYAWMAPTHFERMNFYGWHRFMVAIPDQRGLVKEYRVYSSYSFTKLCPAGYSLF